MIPGEIFTGIAKFQGIVGVNDFRLPIGLQELLQASFRFLRSFRFARIRLNPSSGLILYHDCVSVIVSRFTFFTEDSVISYYQVTNFFCSRYGCASASFARSPCHLGSRPYFAISVFWEVSVNTVHPACHFERAFRI